MTDLLDDYTKAEFPLDMPWRYGRVRLYEAFGDKVVGACFVVSTDLEGREVLNPQQSIIWNGQGIYAEGRHPEMNLPPPPAKIAENITAMQEQIEAAQARLDAMPDAPPEWRGVDERLIAHNEAAIEKLRGPE